MPFVLTLPVNGLAASQHAPKLDRCNTCGLALNLWDAQYDLSDQPKPGAQMSFTQVGALVTSPSFFDRFIGDNWFGLDMRWLTNGYHAARPSRRVALADAPERRACCDMCGQWRCAALDGAPMIGFGTLPIAPLEIVGVVGHPSVLIAGDGFESLLAYQPIQGVFLGQSVGYQAWPRQALRDKEALQGQVLAFPKAPATRFALGNMGQPRWD